MKQLFFFLLPFFFFTTQAQNVGIGTSNPTEKLDVAGNVNINGIIKASGAAGKAGQVLSMNGQGAMQWTDAASSGFKNFATFNADGSWVIPDTVTKISIELWGGGGGGAMGGGGAAGSYALYNNVAVVPGKSINVTIGKGGAGAATAAAYAEGGGTTTATYNNGVNFSVGGGVSAGSGLPGYNSQIATNSSNVLVIPGENGEPNTEAYSQYSSGTFIRAIHNGNGGRSYGLSSLHSGLGGTSLNYIVGNTTVHGIFSVPATCPGSGGGGGENGYGKFGSPGAHGLVIIHF